MSHDAKIASDRKSKTTKEKRELFDKIFIAMATHHNVNPQTLADLALQFTEAAWEQRKKI
jgi:hypothetical protein